MMQRIGNFIDGEIVGARNGAFLDNVEPASGAVYSQVPASNEQDVEQAVDAARRAFPGWSRTPAEERSRVLMKIADLVEDNLQQFAHAETIDSGKPITRAREIEIPRAVQNFRFFATAILHDASECYATDYAALNYTLRRPCGVAGLISPWNLPLYLLTWKIAPAIATGNTAVAKPSELTPMTAHLLASVCREAGLPPGVLNIVHGTGLAAGAPLTAHAAVPIISFTGGTVTGRSIAQTTAPLFKKVSLEMGGKNPTIVFADADPRALAATVAAAFSNQGQICLCGSRIFVERAIFHEFVEQFVERTKRLRLGDPLDAETEQGALVSAAQREKTEQYVQLARDEGGKVLCGGARPTSLPERCQAGFYYAPTAVIGLDAHCRVNQEEIFGPVACLIPFDDVDEVVAGANSTPYGLSASVWTRDVNKAHSVAERLESGTVWVNCWLLRDLRTPFGGMKQSGLGREGGAEALRFFTEPKTVCIKTE